MPIMRHSMAPCKYTPYNVQSFKKIFPSYPAFMTLFLRKSSDTWKLYPRLADTWQFEGHLFAQSKAGHIFSVNRQF